MKPIFRCAGWAVFASAFTALSLQLSGCATPPPVRFHSLLAVDSASQTTPVALAKPGFFVTLAAVSVPPQVDQPQWLIRSADGSFSVLEQERWVAPLRGELQSALLDRWYGGWGGRAALPDSTDAVWRVKVDVTRWEAVPGREVRLESRWTATSGSAVLSCRSVIREATRAEDGPLMLALAASHRRSALRLADEVAVRIREIQKGQPAGCADLPP